MSPLLVTLVALACSGESEVVGPSTLDPDRTVPADEYDVDEDGYLAAEDCDDYDAEINPDGLEVCDGVDNDCDDEVDEDDAADAPTWHLDADQDGFGHPTETTEACSAPEGYVSVASDLDCDDDDVEVNPFATEQCDSLDNDCDDEIDEGHDDDEDGYDDVCDGDCNDGDALVHPGALEICDDIDADCDGELDDEDAQGVTPSWLDSDGDGYGDPDEATMACEVPFGNVSNDQDCDDDDVAISPDAEEICSDYIDNDCDGTANDCDLEGTMSVADAELRIYGTSQDATVGYSVHGADVDGDGWSDLVLGAMTESNAMGTEAGAAYLFKGPLLGAVDTTAAAATLLGPAAEAQSGRRVATCDLDGDGQEDVISGAWSYQDQTGAAVLYLDPLASGDIDGLIAGAEVGVKAGWAVACLGDVDGDGLSDLAMGVASDNTAAEEAGATYLFLGPATSATSTDNAWAAWYGEDAGDLAGAAVSGPGDLDGDSHPDLLVGASLEATGGSNAGASYVVYGPLGAGVFSFSAADAKITGPAFNDKAYEVSSAGDFDRDGTADLLIGGQGRDGLGLDRGGAWLLQGPVTGTIDLVSTHDADWVGEADDDRAGVSARGAGDFNADGAADLIIGAYGHDATGAEAGAAYIVYGPSTGPTGLADAEVKLTGASAGDYLGWSVSTAGDVNADGYDDVIVGAKFESTAYTNAGAAFVVLGSGL